MTSRKGDEYAQGKTKRRRGRGRQIKVKSMLTRKQRCRECAFSYHITIFIINQNKPRKIGEDRCLVTPCCKCSDFPEVRAIWRVEGVGLSQFPTLKV